MSGETATAVADSTGQTTSATTPEDAAAAAKKLEKYKVKVDQEELEVDLDELRRGYTHGKAANKRFQEAAAKEKQVAELIRRAQQGDLGWLKGIVPDEQIRKFAEQELLAHLEFESLSDTEKDLRKERSERERLARQLEEHESAKKQQEQQALMSRAFSEIDADITATLKEYGKKPTPRLVRRIAEEMLANLQQEDAKPLPAKDALTRAKRGIEADLQEWLSEASEDELIKALPKTKLDAIRRHLIGGLQPASVKPRVVVDGESRSSGKKVRASSDAFFKNMEKRLGVR
jgi:hypothetical protein